MTSDDADSRAPPTPFPHQLMLRKLLLLLLLLLATAAAMTDARPSEDTIRYQVQEELPAGTRVGSVVADAGLRRRFPKDVVALLEFRFLSDPAIPVVIGLSDGVIRTSGAIDRDTMPACRQRDSCDVLLDVTVQPVTYFLIIKIVVEVR
jgi:Cadherin-like